jgi:ABC-type Fe3+-citrate transport system substrate-binding protein
MDNIIQFTPAQLIALVLGICGAIVTISAAIGVIAKALDKARAPEKEQNERLDAHEKRLNAHDEIIEKFKEYFDNDDRRFKEIEKSNKITQSALLALLKYSLNGNDTDSLKKAEESLESYLIDK